MPQTQRPVLLIGGSGIVGLEAARELRRRYPDLPITIGGRDIGRAQKAAAEIGNATATAVDLSRSDLGLAHATFGAIAIFVKDQTLNSLRYALDHKIPYIDISTGAFEIGPEAALFIHHPDRAPVLLASQWLAGAAVFPTLQAASRYESITSIRIGAVFDEQDMGGPAAAADYDRLTSAAPASLTVHQGKDLWLTAEQGRTTVTSVDGVPLDARAYSPFDVLSLRAATNAESIRFDFAYGQSASRRRGESYSTEIIIDIAGRAKDGTETSSHIEIVHPRGQAPLTALGVVLGLEALLGLRANAPAAGLYLPELLIDPSYFVGEMMAIGARFDVAR